MQEDINELRAKVESTTASLQEANKQLEKFNKLERRQIKQECYNRRNNIKFFEIKDSDKESVEDTEETLRNFSTKEMKIRQEDVDQIQFETVHRIPTRPLAVKEPHPRPIIAKVSFYQDKEFMTMHATYTSHLRYPSAVNLFLTELLGETQNAYFLYRSPV